MASGCVRDAFGMCLTQIGGRLVVENAAIKLSTTTIMPYLSKDYIIVVVVWSKYF